MDWTEITISVPVESLEEASGIAHMAVPYGIYIEDYSELEKEAMEIAGIDLIDEELLKKDRTKAVIHIYIAPQERPAEAVAFLTERLEACKIDYETDSKLCKNSDWENNWKKYFKPMPVGEKLLIRPTWDDDYDAGSRAVLHLEPGLAFGTGTHDTTRLCLEAIEKFVNEKTDFLDLGCGSGILSIAALLLGAKRAIGVDIDALAVKTAKENGEVNGFDESRLEIRKGNLTDCVSGKFDIIAANIVADVIIGFCPFVSDYLKPEGIFIASGIVDIREAEVLLAFEAGSLEVVFRNESGGWLCFGLRPKNKAER